MGRALYGSTLGAVLCACTLDVHGTMEPDAGEVGGQDAGMSVTIADAEVADSSADPPDAGPAADAAQAPDHDTTPPSPSCDPSAILVDVKVNASDKNSGPIGTTGAACVRYKGSVAGWGISNGQGRMVTMIGASTVGPLDATVPATSAMDPGADGYIYWALTAGDVTYTSVYVY